MLTLGPVQFQAFELPEKMPLGGTQQLIVHKVIGGKRVIDAMGPDDAPLEWSGRFLDENAEMRVAQLDLMRRNGQEYQLTFALRAYRVIISRFTAEMERPYLWNYTIACEVIEDQVAGDGGKDSVDMERQVAEDLAMAEAAAEARDAVLRSVAIASTAVRAAMGDPLARRGLGSMLIAEAQSAVGNSILAAGGDAVAANLAVAAVGGVGGVIAGGDPATMALGFLGTTVSVEAAHSAGLVAASMTRVQTNLGGAVS